MREERVESTGRENDQGDYVGVRALETVFYAGVEQSRPTSRAGSVASTPYLSTSTLVGGGAISPKDPMHSVNSGVSRLPIAHTKDRNYNNYHDSDTLPSPDGGMGARRKSLPAIKLAPSTAQLNGRHRLSEAVDMNLNIPPSPNTNRGPSSPTFGGSDGGDSDGNLSPRSQRSPASSTLPKPEHYAPSPPQLSMPQPEGFRASFVSVHEQYKSQTGSLLMASPAPSGSNSPAQPPEVKTPTMPGITSNDDDLEAPPNSPFLLLPRTYQPTHRRDDSDSSSIYGDKRQSAIESDANRKSFTASLSNQDDKRKTLLAPGAPMEPNRYSDIFNDYYRHSVIEADQNNRNSYRPDELHLEN
ncbi:hypothetical protein BU23DRAFT_555104 [Bimuria novae-zelandiae CBS 107.79]|uniref:Uncharacterized protein n=1 Tax=Bimuria novae-zelandiae CBS 107.79 TaxID=1447943 RepID=A0A6A5V8D9_9PLEO|nr:hypothetical protein BU23DRAFT_555104 [Bimuria novae-zelandiae CBS 107.79]